MGQRLVVELVQNNETIAVVYYHWSAYFDSTIYELRDLCKDILKAQDEDGDILLGILDGLEARGGGIGFSPRNYEEAKKRFPEREIKTDISRNSGLLYLGKEEIQRTLYMAEGLAKIYIDEHEVVNDVFYCEYLPWKLREYYVGLGNDGITIDPSEMTIDECITLAKFMETVAENYLKTERSK